MSGLFWGTIIFALLTIVGVLALGFIHPAPPSRSARPIVAERLEIVTDPDVPPNTIYGINRDYIRHEPITYVPEDPADTPQEYVDSPIEQIAATATDEL